MGVGPGAALGAWQLSGLDSVNLFSGSLSFNLPLLQIGGRGEAGYSLLQNFETRWVAEKVFGGGTFEFSYVNASGNRAAVMAGYAPGFLEYRFESLPAFCSGSAYDSYTLTRLHFVAADGADTELVDAQSNGASQTTNFVCVNGSVSAAPQYYNRGTVFTSRDGTSTTFVSDAAITDNPAVPAGNGWLYFKSGVRYRVEQGRIRWITDRNGNTVNLVYDDTLYNRVSNIVDSLGRQVSIEYGNLPGSLHPNVDHLTFKGSAGASRTVKVRYTTLALALRPGDSIETKKQLFPLFSYTGGHANVNSDPYNPSVIYEIELPNAQKYTFRYNKYGELFEATLPTGGRFEYDWDGYSGQTGGAHDVMIYRRVKEKRTYTASGLASKTFFDAPALGGGPLAVKVIEQDSAADLRKTLHTFHGSPFDSAVRTYPFAVAHWNEGREYETQVRNAAETPVKTIAQTWRQRHPTTNQSFDPGGLPASPIPANDPRIVETQTTADGLTSKRTFEYAADTHNNVFRTCDHDFGAATPIRCQETTFRTEGGV